MSPEEVEIVTGQSQIIAIVSEEADLDEMALFDIIAFMEERGLTFETGVNSAEKKDN